MAMSNITKSYDFTRGENGFSAGFADLPIDSDIDYELASGIRPLPRDLGTPGTGFLFSGNNHSDDLFMFLKRKLGPEDGVVAGKVYKAHFRIRFASDAPSGSLGVGGSPGDSVYLKAGTSTEEPLVIADQSDLRMNVDKGNQAVGGPAASSAGNIANGRRPSESARYVSILREHTHKFVVPADEHGFIWLLLGTDSGFEAVTTIYYQSIEVTLEITN